MATTASNVSVGKPAVGGAIYYGPTSSTLPTKTSDELTGFTSLGYVSEEGLTNSNTPTVDNIKAWGGDVVLEYLSEKADTFKFKLIESKHADVLKVIYGEDNVSEADGEITVDATNSDPVQYAWVVDMVLSDGKKKRIVIPSAGVTDVGDITYNDTDAIGYDITITAMPISGKTHTEIIAK